jgi:imidazolonepropionase-like amidohydrolase
MHDRIIIRGATVITGRAGETLRDGVVVIEAGRIAAVGPRGQFGSIEGEAEVIDAAGGSVMPGLIDTHIHIFHETKLRGLSDSAASLWALKYIQVALRGGVTTIRDLGAQTDAVFGLRRGLASGWAEGPDVLACGRAICMTGGHGWANLSVEADGEEGVRRAARAQLKAGADVIKVMASGGAGTPGEKATSPQLSVAELRAAVEEAHAAGKPASAHALATQGIRNSIEAGFDSIEHGVFLDADCIERMLKRDIALCPTISVYPRIVERGPAGGEAQFVIDKSLPLIERHFDSLRRAVAAGVRIVFGTDSTTLYNPLGDIGLELELMVRAGMSPVAAIVSATSAAARMCGIADRVGTLAPGMVADVLLVDGDATADIGALDRVRLVLKRGRGAYAAGGDRDREALIAELR